MATFDEFLAALRAQESGGNYTVVNSIGAMGAYQVMPDNLPPWSKAALGHSISSSEFLSHPAEQDAIARYELSPVYQAHGPAGAAAWWYSGQTDPTKTYGNPPVYAYVQQVLGRIGKSGSVTPASSTTPAASSSSGTTVQAAGLQQAGYDAVLNLTPWGIPINPFKMPDWLWGKLVAGGLAGNGANGGGAIGGAIAASIGPLILAGLGLATAAGILLIGLYVTAKPTIDKTAQVAQTAATAAL